MANVHREAPLRKLDWIGGDGLSLEIYDDAARAGMTLSMFLESLKAEKQESPYVNLTYKEVLDKKKELGKAAPTTAFEECLEAAGIKAFGSFTDPVSKFYAFSDTDVLFPEYIANRVYAGLLKKSLVPELCFAESVIQSTDFHKIYINDSEAERVPGEVGKGEEFGETKISVAKESIYLTKWGKYLTVAYEDIQYVRLNIFGTVLERVGQEIQIQQTDDMISTIINGDGNSNTPGTTVTADTSGTIGTADVIEWATCLPTPYKMTDFVGKKALLVEYYTVLADFDNPQGTFGFMGVDLPKAHEWDRTVVTADRFFGIDRNYSVEHVTTGAMMTESEKIIRKQISGTAVSTRGAFAILDENANAIFDETT